MECTLISLLGESEGVITEALEYCKKKFEKIENIVLYTRDVREKVKILRKVLKMKELKQRIGDVTSKFVRIPVSDITSQKELMTFRKTVEKVIKGIDRNKTVILNISGGRKIMVIVMLDVVRKIGLKGLWINIISRMKREEIAELGEIVKEKIENNIKLEKEEIDNYFFSKGNYIVLEFSL